jgi:hypothetical protein
MVLQTMSPTLGSRPGIHCCRNSTVNDSRAPPATTRNGRTPLLVRQIPSGMNRMMFWSSSARAAVPAVR